MNFFLLGKFFICFVISLFVFILGGGLMEFLCKLFIKCVFNFSYCFILFLEFLIIFFVNFRIFFIILVGMIGCE